MDKKVKVKPRKSVKIIIFIFLLFFLLFLYARYINTHGFNVKEIGVVDEELNVAYNGLKIVQFSDIHYGRTIKKQELQKIVDKVNQLKPDIIVLTGDLIDKDTMLTDKMATVISDILKQLNASIGKYAITGNHDYKFDKWTTIISDSGFMNLNDRYDIIYNHSTKPIFLGGLSTNIYQKEKKLEEKIKVMNDYFSTRTEENQNTFPDYKILIMHEPDYVEEVNPENYDLILAGHSHDGQVKLPGIGAVILPNGAKKYYKNYYNLDGTDFYISSGIGTSRYNFRLFNRPSINLYRLVDH